MTSRIQDSVSDYVWYYYESKIV